MLGLKLWFCVFILTTNTETRYISTRYIKNMKIDQILLEQKLALAVSFRNLAVHGYEQFDFKQVFYDYKKDLVDLKEFAAQIFLFLKNNDKS